MNQNNYYFFQLTDFQRLKIMKKKTNNVWECWETGTFQTGWNG
jgi:hypothetical protein